MADVKTKQNNKSVKKFLDSIKDEKKRQDAYAVADMMEKITKTPPKMWGDSIVGFGSYHYKYASGREGDWMLTGFSPRKQNMTLYIMCSFDGHKELLKDLGKHSTGVSCLYFKKLDDIHKPTLRKLIRESVKAAKKSDRA